jgi:hypothetical protein
MDADLTLLKAVNQVRQSESVKGQQHAIRNPSSSTSASGDNVDVVKAKGKQWNQRRRPQPKKTDDSAKKYGGFSTNRASTGKRTIKVPANTVPTQNAHGVDTNPTIHRLNCPAKDAICNSCSRVGHFAKIGRSSGRGNDQRQVNVLEEAELDVGFLGEVETTGSKPWMVDLTLGNTNVHVHFKVDTGADVTAIPEKLFGEIFGEIFKSSQLQPSDRTLYGPGQTKLEIIGKFKGVLHLDSNRNIVVNILVNRVKISM